MLLEATTLAALAALIAAAYIIGREHGKRDARRCAKYLGYLPGRED